MATGQDLEVPYGMLVRELPAIITPAIHQMVAAGVADGSTVDLPREHWPDRCRPIWFDRPAIC
jgi:hypothetical protein